MININFVLAGIVQQILVIIITVAMFGWAAVAGAVLLCLVTPIQGLMFYLRN